MEIGVWTPKAVASKTLPLEEVRILPIGDIQYVSRAIGTLFLGPNGMLTHPSPLPIMLMKAVISPLMTRRTGM